jgi:hypothetical protein
LWLTSKKLGREFLVWERVWVASVMRELFLAWFLEGET